MAEEDLAGIKIKDSYEGLLHLSDGGLSTTPGLPAVKPVYDGQGRKTCLNVSSNMLSIKGVAAGLAIDSTNDGDYGFIDQGTTNSGIGLRGSTFYDGNQSSDLYVAGNGNVGVGLENPIARLQTIPRGTNVADDFTAAGLLVGTETGGIAIDADAIRCSTIDSFKIGLTNGSTTGRLTFHTGGETRLHIQADGKIRYPYVDPTHGGPASGKVLTCVGSNGGMAWQDSSPAGAVFGTTYSRVSLTETLVGNLRWYVLNNTSNIYWFVMFDVDAGSGNGSAEVGYPGGTFYKVAGSAEDAGQSTENAAILPPGAQLRIDEDGNPYTVVVLR